MNILDLLGEDGFSPKKIANSWGGTYGCSCPSCKGENRFRSFPNNADGITWLCQKCHPKGGDNIEYLKTFRGMTYREACKYLDISPGERTCHSRKARTEQQDNRELIDLHPLPSIVWQERAGDLVRESIDTMDTELLSASTRIWLQGRGISEETIRSARLGCIPWESWQERESWGLPHALNDNGNSKKLWIPSGVLIPCFEDDRIARLKIRSLHRNDGPKYYLVPGSSIRPMILGDSRSMLIVEGELDCILLHQEAGDLVTILALGSAQMRPDKVLIERLKIAPRILLAFDFDTAGKIASQWWLQHFPNAIRWPIHTGKDPTECFQQGENLRLWVQAGLAYEEGNARRETQQPIETRAPIPDIPDNITFEIDHTIAKSLDELQEAIAPFFDLDLISIHMQTSGPDYFEDKIEHLVLASGNGPVLIIDFSHFTIESLEPLRRLLERPAKKVVHNAKTISKFLSRHGLTIEGPIFDTFLASQVLSAGLDDFSHALGDLRHRYMKGRSFNEEDGSDRYASRYSLPFLARQTAVISELHQKLAIRLQEAGLEDVAELEFECVPVVAQMELNGMFVDREKCTALNAEFHTEKVVVGSRLKAALGDINLNSNPQVLDALSKKGLSIKDTKAETLSEYFDEYPFTEDLVNYRRLAHFERETESYIESINPHTGRIHAQYKQIGGSTGRFSCSGPNLQGVPRESAFRELFIAAPGFLLVKGDFSQIELRIVAEISQDHRMIEAFRKRDDLHRLTASLIMDRPVQDITGEERPAAKAVNFGLIYGMGAKGLMQYSRVQYSVTMTLDEARVFRDRFFSAYQGITQWHNQAADLLRKGTKESRTIIGRRRLWKDPAKITEFLNAPVQGTGVDILKKALSFMDSAFQGIEAKIIGCIHDEIILEVPEARATEAADILKTVMEKAGQVYLKDVPMVAEVVIAGNWAK